MKKVQTLLSTILFVMPLILLCGAFTPASAQSPRLVEDVEVQGNRRLHSEDILYYVKTRPGQVYNDEQVRRDLKSILVLGFFDKAHARVLTQDGARGGLVVVFEVAELPLVREVKFVGLDGIDEAEVVAELRSRRVSIDKGGVCDTVKLRSAAQAIKGFLAGRGWANAAVETRVNMENATTVGVTFEVKLRQ